MFVNRNFSYDEPLNMNMKQNAVGRLLVHGPVSLVRPIVQPTLTCRPPWRVGQYSRHRLELVLGGPRPN